MYFYDLQLICILFHFQYVFPFIKIKTFYYHPLHLVLCLHSGQHVSVVMLLKPSHFICKHTCAQNNSQLKPFPTKTGHIWKLAKSKITSQVNLWRGKYLLKHLAICPCTFH